MKWGKHAHLESLSLDVACEAQRHESAIKKAILTTKVPIFVAFLPRSIEFRPTQTFRIDSYGLAGCDY